MKNLRRYGADREVYEAMVNTPREEMEQVLDDRRKGYFPMSMPILEKAIHMANWTKEPGHPNVSPTVSGQWYSTECFGGILQVVDIRLLDDKHPCWVTMTGHGKNVRPRLHAASEFEVYKDRGTWILVGPRPGPRHGPQLLQIIPASPAMACEIWEPEDICERSADGHHRLIDIGGGSWELDVPMPADQAMRKIRKCYELLKQPMPEIHADIRGLNLATWPVGDE